MKTAMFYFTGTGFTERVAKNLSAAFDTFRQENSLYYIPEVLAEMHEGSQGGADGPMAFDQLGILYPVHSFNAPEIVIRFARLLPDGNGRKVFIVKTAGSSSDINSGSSALLKKVLRKKGYKPSYEELIRMPSNFITRPDDDEVIRIIKAADETVKIVAEEILKGRRKTYRPKAGARIAAGLGRAEWLGAHMLGKFHLKADENCTLCGKCVEGCPTGNIAIDCGKVRFEFDCTFCMRCIYTCPQRAIHIRKPFAGVEVKEWFDLDELMRR